MSKLTMNGLVGGTRGRASRRESIYTKTIRHTGKSYAVKLCNKVTEWSEAQKEHRREFSLVTRALTLWLQENEEAKTAEFRRLLRTFLRQQTCSTLRGYMMSKNMAVANTADSTVTVTVYGRSTTIDLSTV